MRLTEKAHLCLNAFLKPGDYAIDATLGNGHDALHIARLIAPHGHLIGFDIQPKAIEATQKALIKTGHLHLITLHLLGHEKLSTVVPNPFKNNTKAIIFNLGYLPKGDKTCITKTSTTLNALTQSLDYLHSKGILLCTTYPGHPGGNHEAEAIKDWCLHLNPLDYHVELFQSFPSKKVTLKPTLWCIKKQLKH